VQDALPVATASVAARIKQMVPSERSGRRRACAI